MTETDKQWLWHLPEGNAIGNRSIRRLDGYEKASGKAIYTRDIKLPGMLYAKQFESPYAHAKIKSMDTRKAKALPGVRVGRVTIYPKLGRGAGARCPHITSRAGA